MSEFIDVLQRPDFIENSASTSSTRCSRRSSVILISDTGGHTREPLADRIHIAINIGNIGRAIPSLAVLVLMFPIFGLGFDSALFALTLLAIPPILINAVVGLRQVSPQILDSAKGMGLSGRQVLQGHPGPDSRAHHLRRHPDLGRAGGGERDAGDVYRRGRPGRLHSGGASSATAPPSRSPGPLRGGAGDHHRGRVRVPGAHVHPEGASDSPKETESRQMTGEKVKNKTMLIRAVTALLVTALLAVTAACGGGAGGGAGGGDSGGPKVSVGSKKFTEQILLGEMYAQAFEDEGYDVTRKLNLGSEQVMDKSLQDGTIDMYPEYTGTAYVAILKKPPESYPKTAKETYEQVAEFYKNRKDTPMQMLPPAPFENNYGIVMLTKRPTSWA
jgi:hypothetical protein